MILRLYVKKIVIGILIASLGTALGEMMYENFKKVKVESPTMTTSPDGRVNFPQPLQQPANTVNQGQEVHKDNQMSVNQSNKNGQVNNYTAEITNIGAQPQQKQPEIKNEKKPETVNKPDVSPQYRGNAEEEGKTAPVIPQAAKAEPISEAEQISRIRAKKRDRSLALHALVKNLEKLGYSADISMALAEKVGRKEYQQEKIGHRTHVAAVIKDGQLVSRARLEWNDPRIKVTAEKYAEGDYIVYHVIGQDIWFRAGELPDPPD